MLSSASFMPKMKGMLRSINFNDSYLNKMKEKFVVLLVQVIFYKFKGDCSF